MSRLFLVVLEPIWILDNYISSLDSNWTVVFGETELCKYSYPQTHQTFSSV